jgi:hypothetical protein
MLRCACGAIFQLSARNVRAARARGQEPICADCRSVRNRAPLKITPDLRRYWLDRYSPEEIVELASGLFGR